MKSNYNYERRINGCPFPDRLGISTSLLSVFFLLGSLFLPILPHAQNVGIGTSSPTVRLHVVANSVNPLIVDGNPGMYMSIVENGTYRGYWGSYAGNAEDVDFGTGSGNLTGKLHLAIKASPVLTITPNQMVGIGTQSPTEALDIENGNIILNNAPKGIILNGADRPIITRAFDVFTSGANIGLGRWGLFMEPSRLVLGIPNLVGKAWEFATYGLNSTRATILTIESDGAIKRPSSNNANMLPFAYGSIASNGAILSGTGNFTIDYFGANTGTYIVYFADGVSYSPSTHVAVANTTEQGYIYIYQSGGAIPLGLVVKTLNLSHATADRSFSFVVYKN